MRLAVVLCICFFCACNNGEKENEPVMKEGPEPMEIHPVDPLESQIDSDTIPLSPYEKYHFSVSTEIVEDAALKYVLDELINPQGKTITGNWEWSGFDSRLPWQTELPHGPYVIQIKTKEFIETEHEVVKEGGRVQLIDGQFVEGLKTTQPISHIAECALFYNNEVVEWPDSAYSNLFNIYPKYDSPTAAYIDFPTVAALIDRSTDQLLVYMEGGEGESAYKIVWVFDKGIYQFRVIGRG